MKKAIFIVGPTAVGKTALAVKFNKKIPSVLISADSIQVYRGADIISGKDHPKDLEIQLIDVLAPTDSFNVRDFVDRVKKLIQKAEIEHKIPIIVGGTGLYIKSLFSNIETINIPPNKKLRKELAKLEISGLKDRLKGLDIKRFERMNESDSNNPRRLIRAIEIATNVSESKSSKSVFNEDEVLIIGLKISSDDLKKRIKKRVEQRMNEGGLDEAKKLYVNYKKLSPQLKVANGYRQIFEYLQGVINLEEAILRWEISDFQHAKAQMTYFNKVDVNWFDVNKKENEQQILRLISEQLDL